MNEYKGGSASEKGWPRVTESKCKGKGRGRMVGRGEDGTQCIGRGRSRKK